MLRQRVLSEDKSAIGFGVPRSSDKNCVDDHWRGMVVLSINGDGIAFRIDLDAHFGHHMPVHLNTALFNEFLAASARSHSGLRYCLLQTYLHPIRASILLFFRAVDYSIER